MMKMRLVVLCGMSLAMVLPAVGKTYKSTYPVACGEVWPAVKATLGDADNYNVVESDDAQMKATYDVKHSAHVNVSGALLQRKNHVTLVPEGATCQMQVVSNYSGWEHDDQGDFKKRVDDELAKMKSAPAIQSAPANQPGPAVQPSAVPTTQSAPATQPATPVAAEKP